MTYHIPTILSIISPYYISLTTPIIYIRTPLRTLKYYIIYQHSTYHNTTYYNSQPYNIINILKLNNRISTNLTSITPNITYHHSPYTILQYSDHSLYIATHTDTDPTRISIHLPILPSFYYIILLYYRLSLSIISYPITPHIFTPTIIF